MAQGPRLSSGATINDPDPIGGNLLVEMSAELLFPIPFVDDQRQIRSVLFVDGGNVFNTDCLPVSLNCNGPNDDDLRYSVGLAVTWITGFAPITFVLSHPLNEKPGDDSESFQFELGGVF